MDVTLFYALFSATCFALLGFWWQLLQGSPQWLRDPANKEEAKRVYGEIAELQPEFHETIYDQMVVQKMLNLDAPRTCAAS